MEVKHREKTVFPFSAVLGQEGVKNALVWNLVNPRIGGVLICGEKGTAKSTLVRGVPALSGALGIVELPLNCTEDRLVGSIDLERALKDGRRAFDPGLLMEADGNILYVDEVNLLSDYIVNTLLETAASGVNRVEREGLSYSHPSRFILAGSMNQEEGKLRPQFIDRFGLFVAVKGEGDPSIRVEIMKRRLAFEADPLGFIERYAEETRRLRDRIAAARRALEKVEPSPNAIRLAASLAAEANCAGHRGELALLESARAIAALDGRYMIRVEDLKLAAGYALPHRMRSESPPQAPPRSEPEREKAEEREAESGDTQAEPGPQEGAEGPESPAQDAAPEAPQAEAQAGPPGQNQAESGGPDQAEEDVQQGGAVFLIKRWQEGPGPKASGLGNGRRNPVRSENKQGRYVGYRMPRGDQVWDFALDATIRAAAPFQGLRKSKSRGSADGRIDWPLSDRPLSDRRLIVEKDDFREKIRERRAGSWVLFVVDASASMGANKRMKEVKGAILSLLNYSYQKRDTLGLIAFRRESAELLLGFTRSVDLARKRLEALPTGGKTPLARGLDLAYQVLMGLKLRNPEAQPTLVLVSDGRASGAASPGRSPFEEALRSAERIGNQNIRVIILDTENDFIRFHQCAKLNEKMRGLVLSMETLRAEGIVEAVSAYKR